ncbi:MAG: FtsQ-type POTRA domain-containing protein [Bdellovibrio sp.]|nr:FtsQ-type POTRA domain-containing protein [Bdellovibrio sp.]
MKLKQGLLQVTARIKEFVSARTVGRVSALGISLAAVLGLIWIGKTAASSHLFELQSIDVSHPGQRAELQDDEVISLSQIPVGRIGLVKLDFPVIEKNLMRSEWIEDIDLKKMFPHTLKIKVTFREPKAYLQLKKGKLAYVDRSGLVFGSVNLLTQRNLPFFSGFDPKDRDRLREGVRLIEEWERSELSRFTLLSSLQWDSEHGFQGLVVYPVKNEIKHVRAMVNFGHSIEFVQLKSQLDNLNRVISYLSRNYIATRRISIDQGKKVVVKIPYAS